MPQPEPSQSESRDFVLPWIGFPSTGCDWGGCDRPTVALRWSDTHGWLEVCEAHKEGE